MNGEWENFPAKCCWYCKYLGVQVKNRRNGAMDLRPCFVRSGLPPWSDKGWHPPAQFIKDLKEGRFHGDDFSRFMEENAPGYYGGKATARSHGRGEILESWRRLRWWEENHHRIQYTRIVMVCNQFDGTDYYEKVTEERKRRDGKRSESE